MPSSIATRAALPLPETCRLCLGDFVVMLILRGRPFFSDTLSADRMECIVWTVLVLDELAYDEARDIEE